MENHSPKLTGTWAKTTPAKTSLTSSALDFLDVPNRFCRMCLPMYLRKHNTNTSQSCLISLITMQQILNIIKSDTTMKVLVTVVELWTCSKRVVTGSNPTQPNLVSAVVRLTMLTYIGLVPLSKWRKLNEFDKKHSSLLIKKRFQYLHRNEMFKATILHL